MRHHAMVRTQISFDEEILVRARKLAHRMNISLAELCRRGLQELLSRERSDKPWMSLAGSLDGEESDSGSVDDVVYGRDRP